MSVSLAELRGVSFDATGTLFHCPSLGIIYAEVLGRHGVELSPARALAGFRAAWSELDCREAPSVDRWARHPEGARGWWGELIRRVCALEDVGVPSEFAVAELFHRFQQADAWSVYDDVVPALELLAARGIPCVVTSNWDHRLHRVLEALDLSDRFDAVICSEEVGVAKPAAAIFEHARDALGGSGPLLHVGDDGLLDVEGALACGFEALLIDRRRGPLHTLLDVLDLLAVESDERSAESR